MTLKKLAAGSGYEYLTRQVAAADSTELGKTPLADYYAAKGEASGRWTGSGLVGLEGLENGGVVTAEQMKNLFGDGCHPVSGTALGRPFKEGSVAGFDLTFSPAKSVSTLWAVAPPEGARRINTAHNAAVLDALAFLESHAIFTREGAGGARQVETRGLIAAAFLHRDSRADDPDLHTHVAVSNKIQTKQGKWLSIYGTILHEHVVAASEAYNTALEAHLREQLGVRFIDVPRAGGKRPVREIAGVDSMLSERWSRRRSDIEKRVEELAEEFAENHGRRPNDKERIALAQRANLETREAKHEPRSEAEQRTTWHGEAAELLGERGLRVMVDTALHPDPASTQELSTASLSEAADRVIHELEAHRATWQTWHMYAEAQRQVRGLTIAPEQIPQVIEHLVDAVTNQLINLTPDLDPITEPTALTRSDGVSVYRHTGADHLTSPRILAAEARIVDAARPGATSNPDPVDVELALMAAALEGPELNDGQRELVRSLVADPRHVALALAPAGSGKTTAMRALTQVAHNLGYDVVGLAPSAAAAGVLAEATGIPSETLAMLDHTLAAGLDPEFGTHTIVVIDEAGTADTLTLDRIIAACAARGARVRLIGDDQQLAAVGAGGVLRDIATTHGAVRLDQVVRFDDPVEASASLALRDGDRTALGYYLDHDRVHTGDELTSLTEVLVAWQEETAAGRECLMLAPTRDLVARLNRAARKTRLDDAVSSDEVALADGNRASVGDTILTRHNDRRLGISGTDWVKNGDRWTVTALTANGGLRARHLSSGLHVTLPPAYVADHVELGYATTVHAAQGSTADVMHGILTGHEDRQLLYTMLTRGRDENHLHLISEPTEKEEQFLPGIDEQLTAVETLDRIIARDGAAVSATTELAHATSPATLLHEATGRYADAITTATRRLLGADADDALEAADTGPLPWLPAIPAALRSHPDWAKYLDARAERVRTLADTVRRDAQLPQSLRRFDDVLTDQLREAAVVWRAANGVTDDDRSLLGPRQSDFAAARYARHLQRQVDARYPASVRRWQSQIAHAIGDPDDGGDHTLDLACELDRMQASGLNATQMLRRAATLRRPLPEERKVEALAYRVERIAANDAALRPQTHQPSRRSPGIEL
ncbi:TraA/ATP-dependent exoDNAse/relaxase [Nocardioides flavus (ex Wang et al. 2016)]|uniref:TraA/ATP-dependent exoDNAse/relaxase n=1 Tax=Nocardioides flavus (ex Wang et al. 2016) TaxID=2058780 RepID=A0ABQ3HEH1_9ACTN|nr:MobF family relaxase [Nocardioides flavus (ex Wang et al. 2016)]GHE15843.1 TraA/ATP-dependent exoDNAse/relaxase [Nocardioides flavus (ex Wang et al. 2016)]